jgi:hypothetical protein
MEANEPVVEAAPEQQDTELRALKVTSFTPDRLNVLAPEPGQKGDLLLQAFLGPVLPNTYLDGTEIRLNPDAAIGIGEYLVEEGRRVKTGLVTGRSLVGADGRAVELRGDR